MKGYRAVPFEGVKIPAVGWARFGDHIEKVGRQLRTAESWRTVLPGEIVVDFCFGTGLIIRIVSLFPQWECDAIQFSNATIHPPVVEGCCLAGPTMRLAAECLVRSGYQPWGSDGPIDDLVYACRPTSDDEHVHRDDSIYFHELGLVLWTDLQSEEDGVELGELRLGTVMLFRRGYLEARNAEYLAQEMPDLVVALPPLRA
jgi:hypothetical protein